VFLFVIFIYLFFFIYLLDEGPKYNNRVTCSQKWSKKREGRKEGERSMVGRGT